MKYFRIFRQSAAELKDIRCLSVTGLLIAIYAALEFVTIQPSESLKINFGFLAIAAIGVLYGPVVGMFGAGICDLVGFMVKPSGSFNPVFTGIAMVQGLIYGMVAYRRLSGRSGRGYDVEMLVRSVTARVLDVAVINVCLNTLAIYFLFGSKKTLPAMLAARVTKNLIELPIDIGLVIVVIPVLLKTYKGVFGKQRSVA
ncbi:MAG: folate family ECF transporter S component [Oscillospiraceae bacterium]|nr:folate family ECF transporter S component [Oscillospiraceae bacterium]